LRRPLNDELLAGAGSLDTNTFARRGEDAFSGFGRSAFTGLDGEARPVSAERALEALLGEDRDGPEASVTESMLLAGGIPLANALLFAVDLPAPDIDPDKAEALRLTVEDGSTWVVFELLEDSTPNERIFLDSDRAKAFRPYRMRPNLGANAVEVIREVGGVVSSEDVGSPELP
jgi:hypothetical protein